MRWPCGAGGRRRGIGSRQPRASCPHADAGPDRPGCRAAAAACRVRTMFRARRSAMLQVPMSACAANVRALSVSFAAGAAAAAAIGLVAVPAGAQEAPPPIPPIEAAVEIGLVKQDVHVL